MKTKLMQLADDYAGVPSDTYYLDQKYDSRAALEAEVDRVTAERDAQRKVLEQALEALKAQPIETRVVWKDGIDLDVPVAHSKLCKAAITAIQEVLHANKPE